MIGYICLQLDLQITTHSALIRKTQIYYDVIRQDRHQSSCPS